MAKITIQGGDRFRPSRTSIPRAQQVGSVFGEEGTGTQALGQALGILSEEMLEKRQRAIDVDYVTDSNIKAQQEVQRLRTQMLQDREDPVGFSEDFMEKANTVYDRYIASAPSAAAKETLTKSFAGQRSAQFRSAFDSENKAIADGILGKAAENVNLIANNTLDNPSSLQNGLDQLNSVGESVDTILDKTAKENFLKESSREVGGAFIRGLINQGKFEGALQVIDSEEIKTIFSPQERQAFERAVSAAASDGLKKAKENRQLEIDNINDDFLKKEIENTLNVNDILNSTLPATGPRSKDFWLKRLEKTEINSPGNPRLYNKVYDNVEDLTEDEIFELADPTNIGATGRPLNMDQVESLLKVKRGETEETLKTYFTGIKGSLTKADPLLGIKDPQGDLNFMQLKFEAEAMVKRSKESGNKETGLTAKDMFDPNSPRFQEFGGLLFSKYKRSPTQIMGELSTGLTAIEGAAPKKPVDERLKELLGN